MGHEGVYQALVETAPDALVVVSGTGEIVLVNDRATTLFGWAREEMVGRPVELLVPEMRSADHRAHREGFMAAPAGRPMAGDLELTARRRDGSEVAVEVSLSPLVTADGTLVAAHVRDITARRADSAALQAAQEELHESQRRLRAMFDHIPAGLSLRDLEGRYLAVNAFVATTLRTDPAHLVGTDPGEHLDVATREEVRRDDAQVLATRRPMVVELTRPGPDGRDHDYHVVRYPVLDDGGEVTAFGSFSLDVTEQREGARRLAVAEARFRDAFDNAPIGMAIAGTDGRYRRTNAAFAFLTGYTQAQLEGMGIADVTHPDDRERDREIVDALLRGEGHTYQREKRYIRADGQQLWVQVHVTLLHEGEGPGGSQLLIQVLDVTERRHNEETLRRLAERDPLTGLLNRRAFDRLLEQHLAEVERYGSRGALLMVDLDGFKRLNDTRGHLAGDAVLREVASLLTDRLRGSDVAARVGGDEFAVLLTEAGAPGAEHVAASIVADAASRLAAVVPAALPPVTLSVGGVLLARGHAGASAVVAAADAALYEAKARGRNRHVMCSV